MMINKRLIQMVPESKAAICGQVLFQWGSLTANNRDPFHLFLYIGGPVETSAQFGPAGPGPAF